MVTLYQETAELNQKSRKILFLKFPFWSILVHNRNSDQHCYGFVDSKVAIQIFF